MKKWIFTLLLLIAYPLVASHIVGGEFELIHLHGNTYRINLIIYFDKINGAKGALDRNVLATIYRKSDKALMQSILLPLTDSTDVGYTQPNCSHGEIQTKRLFYTDTLELRDNVYNDPAGYFVEWQRCCRNYFIDNILSKEPATDVTNDPNAAGQTFYLEFPPVVMNGQPFINSSPRLFPPLNDFACPYRPYYVDFSGVDDDDGDSLVYSMTVPWSTTQTLALPPPSPGPYPLVTWQTGFSLNNIMAGQPDLRITPKGLLTVTPTLAGLFVFAIQVVQYRNGVQIGLSRRDFQMLVVDGCSPAQAPQIVGIDAAGTHAPSMTVNFPYTTPDATRCVTVRVSDPDSQTPAFNFTQNVTIRAVALNFNKRDLTTILPSVVTATLINGSTHDFSICFPACPFFNGPMEIGIIAFDQSCALPLTDTLKMTVNIQPPPNTPPYYTTATQVSAVLNEGGFGDWPVTALDNELDSMTVYVLTNGFVLADAGMKFTMKTNQKGKIDASLHWDAFCHIYDFTKRTSFQVIVKVDDLDKCSFDDPILATFNLSVKLPGVADPMIDTDLTPDPHEHLVQGLVRKVNETLSFNVTGGQPQGDYLMLRENGPGLLVPHATFSKVAADGSVTSPFQWDIRCADVDLKKQDKFTFQFVLLDTANWCRFIKTDTVTVLLQVLPPDNAAPELVIEKQNATLLANNQLVVALGDPIFLNLVGSDADAFPAPDTLTVKLLDAQGNVDPSGYSFTTAVGEGSVTSPFTWSPECSIFKNAVYQNDYTFRFAVSDTRCFNARADTVTLNLSIHDVSNAGRKFSPGNVITPNGDGCNDYFAVEGIDSTNPECALANADDAVAFPYDNCSGHFQFIRIHNRWGKQVFESTQRNFRWYALNESAGEYFYLIKFSNAEFKGVVSVR